MKRLLLGLMAVLLSQPAIAHDFHFPQLNGHPLADAAHVMPANRAKALDDRLFQIWHQTGRQVAVVTVPTLEGYEIEDYANAYFRQLKLGSKELNDGVLLLVAPKEHKVRIEVGYGLEPYLTDADSSEIIQQDILPSFKAGDMPTGIEQGVEGIAPLITPSAIQKRQEANKVAAERRAHFAAAFGDFISWVGMILGSIAGVFGLYWFATRKKRRLAREERERAEEEARKARLAEQEKQRKIREEIQRKALERQREIAHEAARKRKAMLDAMSPSDRQAFLDREKREAEERAAEAARQAAARRKREEEEEEERRRRDSYSSSSYGSSYGGSSYSSGSDDDWGGGGFSGGGGSSGGGGATGSW